jgi:predicted ABC-type ATPase
LHAYPHPAASAHLPHLYHFQDHLLPESLHVSGSSFIGQFCPPGAGKSRVLTVSSFGVDSFNADDRAALLNTGSYLAIPAAVNREVNSQWAFVPDHIQRRVSCAFETTLRSEITFSQAALARQAAFHTEMGFVALHDFALHLERVKIPADAGGHSAPESVLRAIYEASTGNPPRAIREVNFVHVYDNSRWGLTPTVLLQAEDGEVVHLADDRPTLALSNDQEALSRYRCARDADPLHALTGVADPLPQNKKGPHEGGLDVSH